MRKRQNKTACRKGPCTVIRPCLRDHAGTGMDEAGGFSLSGSRYEASAALLNLEAAIAYDPMDLGDKYKKRRENRPSGEFWAAFLCELCMAEGQFSAGDTECGPRNSQTIIVRLMGKAVWKAAINREANNCICN